MLIWFRVNARVGDNLLLLRYSEKVVFLLTDCDERLEADIQ